MSAQPFARPHAIALASALAVVDAMSISSVVAKTSEVKSSEVNTPEVKSPDLTTPEVNFFCGDSKSNRPVSDAQGSRRLGFGEPS